MLAEKNMENQRLNLNATLKRFSSPSFLFYWIQSEQNSFEKAMDANFPKWICICPFVFLICNGSGHNLCDVEVVFAVCFSIRPMTRCGCSLLLTEKSDISSNSHPRYRWSKMIWRSGVRNCLKYSLIYAISNITYFNSGRYVLIFFKLM